MIESLCIRFCRTQKMMFWRVDPGGSGCARKKTRAGAAAGPAPQAAAEPAGFKSVGARKGAAPVEKKSTVHIGRILSSSSGEPGRLQRGHGPAERRAAPRLLAVLLGRRREQVPHRLALRPRGVVVEVQQPRRAARDVGRAVAGERRRARRERGVAVRVGRDEQGGGGEEGRRKLEEGVVQEGQLLGGWEGVGWRGGGWGDEAGEARFSLRMMGWLRVQGRLRRRREEHSDTSKSRSGVAPRARARTSR